MKKIDQIINRIRTLREESGIVNVANSKGVGGALGSNSPNSNMQGFDPLLKFPKKKRGDGIDFRRIPTTYRKWISNK